MFYKIISNNIPKLYNLSKVNRIELINDSIYLYYNYTSTTGNFILFFGDLKEDYERIKLANEEEAKTHFKNIEKLLK
jgi:hypothetical protein